MSSLSLLSEADRKRGFNTLASALSESKLPCEKGPHRWAQANEFMLMGYDFARGEWKFKHGDTRNYLLVSKDGDLRIPMTDEPFKRGYFDCY